jgi:hypothetical protein
MCLSKRNLHRYIMGMVKLKAFYLPWVRMALFTSFCKSKIPNPSYEQIESPSFVNVLSLLKDILIMSAGNLYQSDTPVANQTPLILLNQSNPPPRE